MLVLSRATGAHTDAYFGDLPAYLREGDLLVLNNSRVIPARLFATRARSAATQSGSPDPSGKIEVLLTHQLEADTWTALVRPSRKLTIGERLHFDDPSTGSRLLSAEIIGAAEFGERTLRFSPVEDFHGMLEAIGHMPLPPYIHRTDEVEDRTRYQTVYSEIPGSAAAPTAGLHFTPAILAALAAKGVEIEYVTLHVGLGTFQPVRAEHLADIRLHAERYTLPSATASALNRAVCEGRRIVAAGTTTTRALEHTAQLYPHGALEPHSGQTSIFLSPGHRFALVQGLLTNFHLPQSTLLMLVSAFAAPHTSDGAARENSGYVASDQQGRERILAAYAHAVRQRYRFFSYGDCMLIL